MIYRATVFASVITERKNHINPEIKNEAKQNQYEFLCASSIIKRLEHFGKMAVFWKDICIHISKTFNPSENVFPTLFLNGLVILTNVGLIACKRFKQGFIGELTIIHIWNNSSIAEFDLLYIFKFRFSWAPEKILKDTKFEGLINKSR